MRYYYHHHLQVDGIMYAHPESAVLSISPWSRDDTKRRGKQEISFPHQCVQAEVQKAHRRTWQGEVMCKRNFTLQAEIPPDADFQQY